MAYQQQQQQLAPDRNTLMQYFQKVDKDNSGAINSTELQSVLSNGSWTPFNPETIRMMIGMFDKNNTSTIDFEEFASLWNYINEWQKCFRNFDKDNSGAIDQQELKQALTSFGYRLNDQCFEVMIKSVNNDGSSQTNTVSFDNFIRLCVKLQIRFNLFLLGYRLSDKFYELVVKKFDRSGRGLIAFDDFIQAWVSIQTLTSAFGRYDTQRTGVITIKYEDFLTLVFGLKF